jgi:hypothetical protein
MRRCTLLLAGLTMLIAGCSASPASTASTDSPEVAPTTVAPTGPQAVLDEQLRQARQDIEAQHAAQPNLTRGCFAPPFVMIRPTELAGFVADPPQVSPLHNLGASVTIRLVDPANQDRWVDFWQGLGCFGVLPGPLEAPTEMTQIRNIEVPGIDAAKSITRTYSWTLADGSKSILLTWNSDAWASPNVGYNLIGHNVDEATLVRIAGSTEPVE